MNDSQLDTGVMEYKFKKVDQHCACMQGSCKGQCRPITKIAKKSTKLVVGHDGGE